MALMGKLNRTFQEAFCMTIQLLLITSCPKTHRSFAKALYIVPDKGLQSLDTIDSRTNYKVGSFSHDRSTLWIVRAAGTASLALLKVYSLVSTASWFLAESTGSRLKASVDFSLPAMCLTT